MQAFGEGGSNFLCDRADLDFMHVAVFAQAVVDEVDDARGDGEAQDLRCLRPRKE